MERYLRLPFWQAAAASGLATRAHTAIDFLSLVFNFETISGFLGTFPAAITAWALLRSRSQDTRVVSCERGSRQSVITYELSLMNAEHRWLSLRDTSRDTHLHQANWTMCYFAHGFHGAQRTRTVGRGSHDALSSNCRR